MRNSNASALLKFRQHGFNASQAFSQIGNLTAQVFDAGLTRLGFNSVSRVGHKSSASVNLIDEPFLSQNVECVVGGRVRYPVLTGEFSRRRHGVTNFEGSVLYGLSKVIGDLCKRGTPIPGIDRWH